MGNPAAFITILELGTYRVKGTINELNVQSLSEGMPVIIRSRVDSSVTWAGSVESIDWENPVKDDSSMYYMGSSDEMTSSSKYPFYITLDTTDGLMLGQHVYLEPDMGQNEQKEGLWLPSWYIVDPEGDPYVWAASKKDKLEKRKLILGKYDADTDTWQIQGGLETSDFIAFPDDTLEEGAAVSYFDETMLPEGNLDAGMDTDLGGATFDGAAIPEGGDAMAVPAA